MKKIYLLFVAVWFTVACEKEELGGIEEIQENPEVLSEEIQFDKLPAKVRGLLSRKPAKKKHEGEKDKVRFGYPRTDIPAIKKKNRSGYFSYTVALKKIKNSSVTSPYFDNAVFTELDKNKYKITVLRYKPTAEWYNSDQKDTKEFSGTVEFYTIKGYFLGKADLQLGKTVEGQLDRRGYSTTCTYTNNGFICTEGRCETLWKETCTIVYHSETTISDGTSPEPVYEEGGGGGGGGGGTVETAPIMPEEEDKVINELEGKADCIFQSLSGTATEGHNIMMNIYITFSDLQYDAADIIYKQEAGLVNANGDILNGHTSKSGNDYIVTLNSDRIYSRSSIEVAKTLLHESIHAIIRRRFDVNEEGFNDAFKKYIESKTGRAEINHAIMRDYYIEPMIHNLKQFDNFREEDKFYRDLAWEGLHQFLTEAEISEILSTLLEARARLETGNCGKML